MTHPTDLSALLAEAEGWNTAMVQCEHAGDTAALIRRLAQALRAREDELREVREMREERDWAWEQFKLLFKDHAWGAYVGAIYEDGIYKKLIDRDAARVREAGSE